MLLEATEEATEEDATDEATEEATEDATLLDATLDATLEATLDEELAAAGLYEHHAEGSGAPGKVESWQTKLPVSVA